jgi:hypothetical protein
VYVCFYVGKGSSAPAHTVTAEAAEAVVVDSATAAAAAAVVDSAMAVAAKGGQRLPSPRCGSF